MGIRDLGYRPYEGDRLPPSNNVRVLLRHGLKRAWSSWLVKLAAFLCWFPMVVGWAAVGLYMAQPELPPFDGAEWLARLLAVELWVCVTMVTLGAGASAISEDLTHHGFQFFFAKPVTPSIYLSARVGALFVWCFALCSVPCTLLLVVMVGASPAELRLERLGLLLPTVLASALVAGVCSVASVATSSLGRSRALTMSAWVLIFLVPHVLGALVEGIGDFPWLRLLSIPATLEVTADALFRLPTESELRWYHAAPALVVVVVGSASLALSRLRRAEVVA